MSILARFGPREYETRVHQKPSVSKLAEKRRLAQENAQKALENQARELAAEQTNHSAHIVSNKLDLTEGSKVAAEQTNQPRVAAPTKLDDALSVKNIAFIVAGVVIIVLILHSLFFKLLIVYNWP